MHWTLVPRASGFHDQIRKIHHREHREHRGSDGESPPLLACMRLRSWIHSLVPVAGPRIVPTLDKEADEVVVVESPRGFRAVAQVYRTWRDVADEEVIEIMRRKR